MFERPQPLVEGRGVRPPKPMTFGALAPAHAGQWSAVVENPQADRATPMKDGHTRRMGTG